LFDREQEVYSTNISMQLLLPSAKTAVLVTDEKPLLKEHLNRVLLILGLLVIIMGGLDLLSRVPAPAGGDALLRAAFAPAATLP
jgi:hypothetical protein